MTISTVWHVICNSFAMIRVNPCRSVAQKPRAFSMVSRSSGCSARGHRIFTAEGLLEDKLRQRFFQSE